MFDGLVQSTVRCVMQENLGLMLILKAILPILCVPWMLFLEVVGGLAISYGMLDFRAWGVLVFHTSMFFVHAPCTLLSLAWMMSKRTHLSGWRNKAWILLGWFLWLSGTYVLNLGLT